MEDWIPGMDKKSATLVLQILVDDVEEIMRTTKGKGPDTLPNDQAEAFRLFNTEIERAVQQCKDRAMCQSLVSALEQDHDLIQKELQLERQAGRDRQMAEGLSGQSSKATSGPSKSSATSTDSDNEFVAKMAAVFVSEKVAGQYLGDDDQEDPQQESSALALNRSSSKVARRVCVACDEEHNHFDVARSPCGHQYCKECINNLYRAATNDESLYPPRCCQKPFRFGEVRFLLTTSTATAFEDRIPELETKDRTYCHIPTCSSWLGPDATDGDTATCPNCEEKTCTMCKGPNHLEDCPMDEATAQFLELAQANGWQRCYSCRAMVDLRVGCNHMTCRCGAQFCYRCGARWKTCSCSQWDEARLLDRAGDILHQRVRNGEVPASNVHSARRQIADDLRENHNCSHDNWRTAYGRYRCVECSDWLPQFIYICSGCNVEMCRRCRFNRI